MRNETFAKRSLGQNFLVDERVIERIIAAVDPQPDDHVVEIGPGRGALTRRLVESNANVKAIELDRDLVPILRETFASTGNFSILEADATDIDFTSILGKNPPCKLVANLPYYISTAILQHLAQHSRAFSTLVLMFQREVVDRITAQPGDSNRGFLTVIVENYFTVERLFDVPPKAFRPQPKVWSSVVRLTPLKESSADPAGFRSLVSTAFLQKRKTIFNNLRSTVPNAVEALESAAIDPKRRAETLSKEEWLRLFEATRP